MSQSLKSCIKQLEEQLAKDHSALQGAYFNLKSDVCHKMTSPKSLALAFFSGFSLMYFNKQKSQQAADPKKLPLLPALTHASNFILLGERLKSLFGL